MPSATERCLLLKAPAAECVSIDYSPEQDQILISFRTMEAFYVIDHGTTTAEVGVTCNGREASGAPLAAVTKRLQRHGCKYERPVDETGLRVTA